MSEAKNAEEYYYQGMDYEHDAGTTINRTQRINLYQKAANAYLKAAELDPTHEMAWIMAGLMFYDHLNKPNQALQCWIRAADVDPKNEATQCKIGNALLASGQKQAAYEQYDNAIQRFMDYTASERCHAMGAWQRANHLVIAGTECCKRDAPDKALELYSAALQLNPKPEHYTDEWPQEHGESAVLETRQKAYCRLGIALLLLGRENEAQEYLNSVGEMGFDDTELGLFLGELGYAYKKLGRNKEALSVLEKAKKIWSGWSDQLTMVTPELDEEIEELQSKTRKRFGFF